jgi:hypothetical protein|tara:strand:- start:6198 stop:6851 length:654 start_codon:yes stop_codon:yes gene_type:complete
MKLSNETREVLKNYSTINSNLLVKAGNTIATMSQMKNIVATATVPDTFETEFAIYDLNEFLSAMSLFTDPELTFNDQSVRMSQGSTDLTYFYSDPSVVTTPKTEVVMPSVNASFTLTQSTFTQVQKAAAVLGVPDMVLEVGHDGIMDLRVSDRKNDTSNNFSIEVGEGGSPNQKFYFKVENLKLLNGDYNVEVSDKGISKFTNLTKKVEYFIALEAA